MKVGVLDYIRTTSEPNEFKWGKFDHILGNNLFRKNNQIEQGTWAELDKMQRKVKIRLKVLCP